MKRLTALLIMALAACTVMSAQSNVAKVLEKLGTNRVCATYDCTIIQNNIPVSLSGKALVQGNCFHLNGNGMEIWCDSEKLWYVDPKSKEVYIENALMLDEYIKENIGAVKDINLTNVSYSEISEDLSAFRLDTAALDKSWVVTDLR